VQQRNQQAAKAQQWQQQKQVAQKAEAQAAKQRQQQIIDEYNLAYSNVQQQLECRARLNMRDFDIAIKKLQSLNVKKYNKEEAGIISALVGCISNEAKSFPERAAESKRYALRIFNDHPSIAAIEIIPRDSCDSSIAGLGSRGQRATCSDEIKGLGAGPELVVMPTGKGIKSFAISRHEVSVAEFKHYCGDTMACSVSSMIDEALPITSQSLSVINGYIRWLTDKTGNKYRLPTLDEWVYAATANKVMEDPNRNCFFSSRQIQKGDSLVKTTIGKQNGWGLVNYLGNAEELVYEKSGKVSAVGGSYKNAMDECKISYKQPHDGQPNDVTGFRVVRELTIK
jgi:hypothetical protein